jgi:hypothetical protein
MIILRNLGQRLFLNISFEQREFLSIMFKCVSRLGVFLFEFFQIWQICLYFVIHLPVERVSFLCDPLHHLI